MKNWAVIRSGSKQYLVQEGDQIDVEKLPNSENKTVSFDEVLLISREGESVIGTPFIDKAKVSAKVISDIKSKKIKVVKFKSKSRYLKTQGHRQQKTRVEIEKIKA